MVEYSIVAKMKQIEVLGSIWLSFKAKISCLKKKVAKWLKLYDTIYIKFKSLQNNTMYLLWLYGILLLGRYKNMSGNEKH